jgi:hypothetical protein
MANYTRAVAASDRAGLRNLLAMHEQVVGPVLTNRGGRIVKNIGDSFMALFDSATDAIHACVELIEAHRSENGVAFRAGIATGDVEETESDAFGEVVNLAARIISQTPTGEVWFSNATRHCMNQAEISWDTTGRHTLKGIPGDIEIFRAVPRHLAFFPDTLAAAARTGQVVRWRIGESAPVVGANGHVLLEANEHRPNSPEVLDALARLPHVEPARIWLVSHRITPADRYDWMQSKRGLVVATDEGVTSTLRKLQEKPVKVAGTDTIILDGGVTSSVNVVLAGVALPAVPLAEVVAGYSYDLLADGRWFNRSDRGVIRVEVNSDGATLTALAPGVQVGGDVLAIGATLTLKEGMQVRTPAGPLVYKALGAEGYLGALIGDTAMQLGVSPGQPVELGRQPEHPGMFLPDRGTQEHIQWVPGPRAERVREKGFTLDKVLTGRRQASVSAEDGIPVVTPLHPTCATLLLDELGRVNRLAAPTRARVGDVLLLGTVVVALREPLA